MTRQRTKGTPLDTNNDECDWIMALPNVVLAPAKENAKKIIYTASYKKTDGTTSIRSSCPSKAHPSPSWITQYCDSSTNGGGNTHILLACSLSDNFVRLFDHELLKFATVRASSTLEVASKLHARRPWKDRLTKRALQRVGKLRRHHSNEAFTKHKGFAKLRWTTMAKHQIHHPC